MTGPRREIEHRLERALRDVAMTHVPPSRPIAPLTTATTTSGAHWRIRSWLPPLLAASVVVLLGAGISLHAALTGTTHRQTPNPGATSTPLQTPTPTPSASSAPRVALDPRNVDFGNSTITIPDWHFELFAHDCPPGPRRFTNWRSTAGPWPTDLNRHIVYGNLDGAPGDEAVLSIECANAEAQNTLVFAVTVRPDGSLATLGGAINIYPGGLLNVVPESVAVHGSTVTMTVTGPYIGPGHPSELVQQRGYQLRGGAFVQVSGPTTFVDTDIKAYGDCRTPSVEPSSIIIACADHGIIVQNIQWTSWSPRSATGYATFHYNDCTPSCASGHFHDIFNTHITLTGPVHGAGGQLVWSSLYASRVPPGYPRNRFSLPVRPG